MSTSTPTSLIPLYVPASVVVPIKADAHTLHNTAARRTYVRVTPAAMQMQVARIRYAFVSNFISRRQDSLIPSLVLEPLEYGKSAPWGPAFTLSNDYRTTECVLICGDTAEHYPPKTKRVTLARAVRACSSERSSTSGDRSADMKTSPPGPLQHQACSQSHPSYSICSLRALYLDIDDRAG